jgi:hypothetical protein
MYALDQAPDSLAGIAACYSIIHTPRDEVPTVLDALRRVLRPGGELLLSFHLGDGVIHLDDVWGEAVDVDFVLFERSEMEGYLRGAGFRIDEVVERDPYPEIEIQTRRACFFASKVEGQSAPEETH